jgi:fluoride ion exporter CrcB/FEX
MSAPRLSASLLQPTRKLLELPGLAKATAAASFVWQYVSTDMFGGALAISMLASLLEYLFWVSASKKAGEFTMATARANVVSKLAGISLALLIRVIEAWAEVHKIISTHGGLGTAVAVSLIAIELQSLAHHRETFGGKPLGVVNLISGWLAKWAESRVPKEPS